MGRERDDDQATAARPDPLNAVRRQILGQLGADNSSELPCGEAKKNRFGGFQYRGPAGGAENIRVVGHVPRMNGTRSVNS